jgi:hypothetical protein
MKCTNTLVEVEGSHRLVGVGVRKCFKTQEKSVYLFCMVSLMLTPQLNSFSLKPSFLTKCY